MLRKLYKTLENIYFLPQTFGEKKALKKTNFIIISNNCWGYEIYKTLGRPYNTPFVGLFLFPDCYIKFLQNFPESLNWKLTFTKKSKYVDYKINYPIGLLNNDIEIHFMHYKTEEEAKNKWMRRIDRMKFSLLKEEKIFVKMCDSDNCLEKHLIAFHKLSFKNKISISINPFKNSNHIYVPELANKNKTNVINGLKLFKYRYKYFDFTKWLKDEKISNSMLSKLKSIFC